MGNSSGRVGNSIYVHTLWVWDYIFHTHQLTRVMSPSTSLGWSWWSERPTPGQVQCLGVCLFSLASPRPPARGALPTRACLRREGHEERGPDKAAAWRQHAAPRHTRHAECWVLPGARAKHLAQSRILDLSSIHRGFRHRRHAERALAGTGASGLHPAAWQAT